MSANDEVNANVTIINDVSVAEKDGISVEDGIFNLASEKQDVREINLPRSEVGWFQNSRKQNLHFRMYYKHHEPIKAVIFYFHGYAGECFMIVQVYLSSFVVNNCCYIFSYNVISILHCSYSTRKSTYLQPFY
mgnify:CR=1 FL=1